MYESKAVSLNSFEKTFFEIIRTFVQIRNS
jgi:hypothetical protein